MSPLPGNRKRRIAGVSLRLWNRRGSIPSHPRSSPAPTHSWAVRRFASRDAYRRNAPSHEGFLWDDPIMDRMVRCSMTCILELVRRDAGMSATQRLPGRLNRPSCPAWPGGPSGILPLIPAEYRDALKRKGMARAMPSSRQARLLFAPSAAPLRGAVEGAALREKAPLAARLKSCPSAGWRYLLMQSSIMLHLVHRDATMQSKPGVLATSRGLSSTAMGV